MAETTVSLCLIVKNESNLLRHCINSAKHVVQEIVVVDTGSTDDTLQIATEVGAKTFFHPWNGNFSEARNFALLQATGQWILVLDADEVLAPVEAASFKTLLCNDQVEGYFLTIHSYQGNGKELMEDHVVRLFRNKSSYRFSGAIHEQVAASILQVNEGKGLHTCPLLIEHYGYLAEELQRKDKFSRNTSIILRELEKTPSDPFLLYCLALEYYQRGLIEKGFKCLAEAIPGLQGSEGYFADVIVAAANGLLNLGLYKELNEFVEKYLKILPESQSLLICRGLGHMQAQEYQLAAEDLLQSLPTAGCKYIPEPKHLCLVGDALVLAGKIDKAVDIYISSLNVEKGVIYPIIRIVDLIKEGQYQLIEKKLSSGIAADTLNLIWRQLVQHRKPFYAMVIIILEIGLLLRIPSQEVSLSQLVLELYQLIHYKPFQQVQSFEYLCVSVRELYLCSLMMEKGYFEFLQMEDQVWKLKEELLSLVVKDF